MLQTLLDLTWSDDPVKIDFYLAELKGLEKYWRRPVPLAGKFYIPKPVPLPVGTFSILVIIKHRSKSLFHPAFIVPLRWNKSISDHDRRLPKPLAQLADRIKEQLRQDITAGKTEDAHRQAETLCSWYLEPGLKDFPDISSDADCFSWDSGSIPLAASLLLAALDGNRPPKPDVFVSGSWNWDRNRLQGVDGLPAKIEAAERLGGTRFFLPEINYIEDPDIGKQNELKISRLPVGKSLLETVEELRRVWLSEPPDDASPEEFERYYMQMEKDQNLRRAFYRKRLASEIAHRANIKRPMKEKFDLFVSWVSTGAELINVAADYFKPEKMILLYTSGRMENLFRETCQSLNGFNTEGICFDKPLRFSELNPFLKSFFQQYQGQKIAIDLTLGTVPMTLALRENAPGGTVMVYWYKEGDSAFNIKPFSTEPEIFIKSK